MSFLAEWNPSRDIFDIFADSFMDGLSGTRPTFRHPTTHIERTEAGFEIQLAVPGVPKEQVKVDVRNNTVTISYDQSEKTPKSISTRSFSKSWTLPKNADVENITATAENGILTVTVPETETTKSARSITVS